MLMKQQFTSINGLYNSRNLLRRVVNFSLNEIQLVFVADGFPPSLKHNTIIRRLNLNSEELNGGLNHWYINLILVLSN